MKTCTKCGATKPTTEFYKAASNLDGLTCRCNECIKSAANPEKHRTASAKYRAANPEKVKASHASWRASNPEKVKAKRNTSNPEKRKAYNAKWRAANPEARRILEHNRRARKLEAGGNLSKGLSERLFKHQRGKCACCGEPLGSNYHLDHIMPLALGGANEDWNIQLLRQRCNNQKSAKHPIDFMQQRGFLL